MADQLIPRKVLFGNPDRAAPQISPDGKHISYLAPDQGVLNVWVAPVDDLAAARAVTKDRGRGIHEYFWAYNNKHVLYLQDKDGDENWRVFAADLTTGEIRDLTPIEGVQARIQEVHHEFPDALLIGLNDRQPELHDLHRVDINTGERTLVCENPGLLGFETVKFEVKLGMTMQPDGSIAIVRPTDDGWAPLLAIEADDTLTTGVVDFDNTGTKALMLDSRGRDTAALVEFDLTTQQTREICNDDRADVDELTRAIVDRTTQAAAFTYDRKKWVILDDDVRDDFAALEQAARGDFSIESRTLDDRVWIVSYERDNGPRAFYRYDRDGKQPTFLFNNRTALESLELAEMRPVLINARDGQTLVSYLTLPTQAGDKPDAPLPFVLDVHGGPWYRDRWGYNPDHQWLANRGYAVLSVNFRSSTGFGKAFINAGNREWGAAMHNDLLDAVQWAIEQGFADPQRVAIIGGSYGGYATLWAMTQSPDVFACGVDIVGPSNLITLLESIPAYWQPQIELFATRVGDHRNDEGREFLKSRSPLTFADQLARPLLIAQGANDPRVKQTESDQIVAALQAKNIPVTYALFPDEGHGFARPENNLAFNAVCEAFLAQHIGGSVEPVGSDFEGASINLKAGADQVPGLA